MSDNWNVLTVTNLKGDPIHLGMMVKALEDIAGFDNHCGDFGNETLDYASERVADPEQPGTEVQRDRASEVHAEWHSEYMAVLDLSGLSTFLGSDFEVSHLEEWTDEEPGRTVTVYRNGQRDGRASSTLRDVSDELLAVAGDALIYPRILTWDEVTDSHTDLAVGSRFLVLPPAAS